MKRVSFSQLIFCIMLCGTLLAVDIHVLEGQEVPSLGKVSGKDERSDAAVGNIVGNIPGIAIRAIEKGFKDPVYLTYYPGLPGRLLVVEQAGKVVALQDGKRLETPFLDLTSQVSSGGEKGLLSIAFYPQLEKHNKVFANYTAEKKQFLVPRLETIVSSFSLSVTEMTALRSSEREILRIVQPYENHNGGQIAFGPDGYLYIGMGDGGLRMDPHGHGQDTQTLLGDMLRIDPTKGTPYEVPPDNPFVESKRGAKEIFAWGLRNPWRFSFDRKTGTLWAGDVGQDTEEEIDIIEKGMNYGWGIFEGTICLRMKFDCLGLNHQPPIVTYGRKDGVSVTGGYVYRGKLFPRLDGIYFFGDFGSGKIWGLKYEEGKVLWHKLMLDTEWNISSFGEDENGELYVVGHPQGEIFQIVEQGVLQ